jgi:hypothetical protein
MSVRGAAAAGAEAADVASALPRRIAELTPPVSSGDGLPAYIVPPLVPCAQGAILGGPPRPQRGDATPPPAPKSSEPTTTTKLLPKKKPTKLRLTKAQKRADRITKIRERAYKPRLLDHAYIRRITTTADTWWHVASDSHAAGGGEGLTSLFSWAEWSSEQLRTGEVLLQHHCAKHFHTTWSASGETMRQRIISSLLTSFAEAPPNEPPSSSTTITTTTTTTTTTRTNAALMLEHLALGRPSGNPPFVAQLDEVRTNNRAMHAAGGLAVYLSELELAATEYVFGVTGERLLARRRSRMQGGAGVGIVDRGDNRHHHRQKRTYHKNGGHGKGQKKQRKPAKQATSSAFPVSEPAHVSFWRTLNLLLTLLATHKDDAAFREELRQSPVGETGRTLAAFSVELLLQLLPDSPNVRTGNRAKQRGSHLGPLPVRKIVLLAAMSLRAQAGSLAEVRQMKSEAARNTEQHDDMLGDQKAAVDENTAMSTRNKPAFPLKARKGRVFEAEQRVSECRMDAAVGGGFVLSEHCTILQHPGALRKHLHRRSEAAAAGGYHASGARVDDISAARATTAASTIRASATQLFGELEPHLRNISVVLVQLLLACTPRASTNKSNDKTVAGIGAPPSSPSRNLLVDATQDYVYECAQPKAFTGGGELRPPIIACSATARAVGARTRDGDGDGDRNGDGATTTAPEGCPEPSAEPSLLLMGHKLVVSRAVSQIILSLLKLFRTSHVLRGHCFAQHLVDAQAILAGLTWLNVDLSVLVAGDSTSSQYASPTMSYFGSRTHRSNAFAPATQRNAHMACLNVLRVLQTLTKHFPERISGGLVKYNSAILLKKVLRLQRRGCDAAAFYALKLFKSQARYLGVHWRKGNMAVVNGVSRNVRIDLGDRWLIPQDPGSVPGAGGMLPGEGMYSPSEAATRWAVKHLLEQQQRPQQRQQQYQQQKQTRQLGSGLISELRKELAESEQDQQEDEDGSEVGLSDGGVGKGAAVGEDASTSVSASAAPPDALLCLDGVDVEELLLRPIRGEQEEEEGDGEEGEGGGGGGLGQDGFGSGVGDGGSATAFQVDGAGYFELYQNTSLPAGFEHRWREWCAAELA